MKIANQMQGEKTYLHLKKMHNWSKFNNARIWKKWMSSPVQQIHEKFSLKVKSNITCSRKKCKVYYQINGLSNVKWLCRRQWMSWTTPGQDFDASSPWNLFVFVRTLPYLQVALRVRTSPQKKNLTPRFSPSLHHVQISKRTLH